MACEPHSLWQSSVHPSLPELAGVILQIVVVRKVGIWHLKIRSSCLKKLHKLEQDEEAEISRLLE